jgi:hypothetical protein
VHGNLSWIFLSLCNNGIDGKELLERGIIRDMFLMGCNPNHKNARNLVITCFTKLGNIEKARSKGHRQLSYPIQNAATNGAQKHILNFST